MPARSRKRRDKNAKIKRERNRVKELKTLKKTLGLIDKDGKALMMEVEEIVDEKNVEAIKARQSEKLIEQEFVEEKRSEIEHATYKKKLNNKRKMTVINTNTGKTHVFDTKTLRDQFNSYPNWLNVGNFKRKIKKRKTAMKKNNFISGAMLLE